MSFLMYNLCAWKKTIQTFCQPLCMILKVHHSILSFSSKFFCAESHELFSVPGSQERGLAIITPRVALIQISQGDRVGRESNRKCETQKGIKRETKAQEEGKDWKREFKMRKEGECKKKKWKEKWRKKREEERKNERV